MYCTKEKTCLVIPCYNEAKRLDFKKFSHLYDGIYMLFVNDGSKDNTLEVLTKNKNENIFILDLKDNVGKAEAVRLGMNYAKGLPFFDGIHWIGYWDADLSTPIDQVDILLSYKNMLDYDIHSIWGSRVLRLGSEIKRNPLRHVVGRIFATVISLLLKVKAYDTQCGAKLFKKEILDVVFNEKFISPWIFDVEILLRLKQYNIVECPLSKWKDVKGSKIKFIPVAVKTLIEIIKIRRKYKDIIK